MPIPTYEIHFDSLLNAFNSLLNVPTVLDVSSLLDGVEGLPAELLSDGVIGGFSATEGVEIKTDKASRETMLQSRNFVSGAAGWQFKSDGSGECQDLTVRGTLNASDITAGTLDIARIANNSLTSAKMKTAIQGWSHDIAFSVTDANTVAWALGVISMSDGATTYNIAASDTDTRLTAAGLTSPMNALVYIYLDIAVSTTELQCSYTASTAVGDGKLLLAVAQNSTTEATFQVFGGIGGLKVTGGDIENLSITASQIAATTITAAKIAADTITANEIAANTITATEMNVATLSAISADIGSITAGSLDAITITGSSTITGAVVRTAASPAARIEIGPGQKLETFDSNNFKRFSLVDKTLHFYKSDDSSECSYITPAGTNDEDLWVVGLTNDLILRSVAGKVIMRVSIYDALTVSDQDNVLVGDLARAGKSYFHIKGDDDSDDDPGCLVLYNHAGTPYYLWVDQTGDLRIHTSSPSDEDADGVVVGSQS